MKRTAEHEAAIERVKSLEAQVQELKTKLEMAGQAAENARKKAEGIDKANGALHERAVSAEKRIEDTRAELNMERAERCQERQNAGAREQNLIGELAAANAKIAALLAGKDEISVLEKVIRKLRGES